MTMHEYYIMTLKDLKDAINLAWGAGAETEKAEICDALQR